MSGGVKLGHFYVSRAEFRIEGAGPRFSVAGFFVYG